MRIILLGAPGSGKGTQGPVLAKRYGSTHISTGDLLRTSIASGSELGQRVHTYVQAGELVPDEVVLELLWGPLQEAAASGGYVLDGFPRSMRQAEEAYRRALLAEVTADAVVYLAVPDEVVRERIAARAAEGREDDTDPYVTERRLRVFHAETEPLLAFYDGRGLLVRVDASGRPDEVSIAMTASLDVRAGVPQA
ncbi:MAG: adenylate kinase family protein [Acidimicrobiales bacterium]